MAPAPALVPRADENRPQESDTEPDEHPRRTFVHPHPDQKAREERDAQEYSAANGHGGPAPERAEARMNHRCGLRAALSSGGAALLLVACADARAQPATPTTAAAAVIDPSRPLPPLPDLGVPWPTADAPPAARGEAAQENATVVRYKSSVTGIESTGTSDEFRTLSTLRNTKEPANLAQIALRARADEALLDRLLRAHGYYGATIASKIVPAPAAGGEASVALTVTPGARYDYGSVVIVTPEGAPRDVIDKALALAPGSAVDAAQTIEGREQVQLALPNAGYPFARVAEPEIVVDHDARRARYSLKVDPGPQARFGRSMMRGRPVFGARHLRTIARFKEGEVYNQALVDDLRRALIATSLFSSVQIAPKRRDESDGAVLADLDVAVAPAKLRTVSAELGYDTIDGIRFEASWRHRNLVPPEGAVTGRVVFGDREQSLGGDLVFSNWRRRDQTLALTSSLGHFNTQAYESYALDLNASVQRRTTLIFQKDWTYSYGIELAASNEQDRGLIDGKRPQRQFFFLALPGSLGYDGSNDVLDPTRGFRLNGRASPEFSLEGSFSYLRLHVDGSLYQPIAPRLIAAGRLAFGAIVGAPLGAIPPSRRFYVGGGGSVRGYGYQDIGPKDANNVPVGGRSSTELALEFRYKVTKTIGVVPFLDAGSLYTSEYPKFRDFQYGAGLGVRYYSAFGPIRFDAATPLNPRKGDPTIAVYVSIGQAF